ncbi:MAG TPA: hypothetical protein VK737_12630 [Opitutales bacterium]|jgi:hypothetical protein|nr:hypothetical protein [Opitutales bacterium]
MRLIPITTLPSVRRLGLAALLLFALVSAGCNTAKEQPKQFLEFFLETTPDEGGAKEFKLQDTGQIKYHKNESFMTIANVLDVQPGTVDVVLADDQKRTTPCVFFTLDAEGQRQLQFNTISTNFGKKIYLFAADTSSGDPSKYEEKPIGVRPIDQMISDGPLFMFLALPDMLTDRAKFEAYVADLKDSVDKFQALKNKK